MSDIKLENVTKRYPDGYEAVKDMTLEIEDGEFMILVGPSGCGKSTALRMVAGLEDISDGELRIGENVVNDKAPKDRDIAMVFQNYALYPHMTVRENMGFALKLAKVDKAEINRKVEEAAEVLDLEQHLDRKPANLSGGQRQRVAMGRAIVRDPAAFLMDEPLSNLDAKLRVQMRTEVSRIQQRLGTTTIYVTHDQTEAMTLGDRVAVMRSGVLQQVGSPMELYNEPKNLFVAGFIGSPAMNFMPATVEGGKLTAADRRGAAARRRVGRQLGHAGGRHPARGLRGRGGDGRRRPRRHHLQARTSRCSRRWAPSCTRTSRSAPTCRWSPRSCASWPPTRAPATSPPAARRARSWPAWTPPRRSRRARRPSCGWTPPSCTSSTPATAAACARRAKRRRRRLAARARRVRSPTRAPSADAGGCTRYTHPSKVVSALTTFERYARSRSAA